MDRFNSVQLQLKLKVHQRNHCNKNTMVWPFQKKKKEVTRANKIAMLNHKFASWLPPINRNVLEGALVCAEAKKFFN